MHTYTDTGKAIFSSPSTNLPSPTRITKARLPLVNEAKKRLVTINARSFWSVQVRPIPLVYSFTQTSGIHRRVSLVPARILCVAKNKVLHYCATFLVLALVPLHGIMLTPHDQFRSVESFKFCCTNFPLGSHTTGNLLGPGRRGRPCLHCASGQENGSRRRLPMRARMYVGAQSLEQTAVLTSRTSEVRDVKHAERVSLHTFSRSVLRTSY